MAEKQAAPLIDPPLVDPEVAIIPSHVPDQHYKELAAKFVFAGTGSVLGTIATNPFDIIKVRQQLQGEGVLNQSTSNLFRISYNMFRNEGPLSFYNGLVAAMLREATYSTIRFGSYDWFKSSIMKASGGVFDETSLVTKITAGLTSGMVGAAIANPTDLVKVRMQAYNPSPIPRYRGVGSAFAEIYRTEGWAGLYRGVWPTTGRAAVVTASQMATYDHIKHWVLGTGYFVEGIKCHFVCSMLAGFVASLTSAPIDTLKVRYMNQPFDPATGTGLRYPSAMSCLRHLMATEGPLALYKGFFMCWFRLGPHTIISLMVFEQLRKITGINPI
ncbi:hypothetical protein BZG36_01059 [Bifiguratus adelaidae]|uniref:Mitochondrial dicarboxylate transporter n=1 Tax=Bifiguratus adelaidae TaxID=1938954 RepID=A0A261Y6J3_9FUNG|nr:hypothetical protein BZG36_01059 [Bifiguratus adelaidae]